MKKTTLNKLRYIIALEAILVLLFCIIVFAVPFENKFNGAFWTSFVAVFISMVMIFAMIAIVFTQEKYKNDKCANKLSLISCIYSVVSVALSIILIVVNGNSPLQVYLPIILVACFNAVMIFLLIFALISSESNEEAE